LWIQFSVITFSQEYFFEFVPGWVNSQIFENEDSYISVGLNLEFQHQFAKINSVGETIDEWDFNIDTALTFEFNYTNDFSSFNSSFLATGVLRGVNSDRFYGTLFRFNSDFSDTVFSRSFNLLPGNGTMILSHTQANDTTLILGGYLQDTDFTIYSALIETDTLGNIHWRQNYYCGNGCELKPYHIQKASDNGYFYTCKEFDYFEWPFFNEKTAIIKTDSLGNEQYRLHPGNPDLFTVAGWVLPTDDGNYITAYSDPMVITDNLPQSNPDKTIWINKFDIEGNEIFNISLLDYLPKTEITQNGLKYYIKQMLLTNDNNILIVGYKTTNEDWGFILKITQQGEPLWYRFISPPQTEGNDAAFESTKILGITPTSDGGYIMAGEYISTAGNIFPNDIQTAIAVKVDSLGCLVAGCDTIVGIAEIPKVDLGLRVYPNPASDVVNVVVGENVKVEWIRVYEVSGRVMLSQSPLSPLSQGGAISVDVSDLSPGMYLMEVETETGLKEVRQFVIE
jgi:hypothetical protein